MLIIEQYSTATETKIKKKEMFTPVHTTIGALLLHQATSNLLLGNGKILGASGLIRNGLLHGSVDHVVVLAGIITGTVIAQWHAPASLLPEYDQFDRSPISIVATVATGAIIGLGTNRCNGCTSGHMLCGLSRFSGRSAIATAIFFTTALITANFFVLDNVGPCVASDAHGDDQDVACYLPEYPTMPEFRFMITVLVVSTSVMILLSQSSSLSRFSIKNQWLGQTLVGFMSGMQFGLGLIISGMAKPDKVIRFFSWLDWRKLDPSLALIIVFGIGTNIYVNHHFRGPWIWTNANKKPTFASHFQLPSLSVHDIGITFISGAVLFGIGWGLTGTCPGPGIIRSVFQPWWGVVWLFGFLAGSSLPV
ncbi:hypothetical protein V1514DRAFT_154215 [Lipomyces japonicus]|uniref:uncharacterized protein n=1 Tax=Lipomyces japonicus TaxID=56871 RepID=UPI0034CF936F